MTTCPAAPHPEPRHLMEILPPVAARPELVTALSAGVAGCHTCMVAHRRAARDAVLPVHQVLTLFLMYAAIVLNANGREPGKNTGDMVKNLAPGTFEMLSPSTGALLTAIPVQETTAPDGTLAATWDPDLAADELAELPTEHRTAVWSEALGLLIGIVRGEGRARDEADL